MPWHANGRLTFEISLKNPKALCCPPTHCCGMSIRWQQLEQELSPIPTTWDELFPLFVCCLRIEISVWWIGFTAEEPDLCSLTGACRHAWIQDVQLVIEGALKEDIAQFPAKTSKQGAVIKQDMSLLVNPSAIYHSLRGCFESLDSNLDWNTLCAVQTARDSFPGSRWIAVKFSSRKWKPCSHSIISPEL